MCARPRASSTSQIQAQTSGSDRHCAGAPKENGNELHVFLHSAASLLTGGSTWWPEPVASADASCTNADLQEPNSWFTVLSMYKSWPSKARKGKSNPHWAARAHDRGVNATKHTNAECMHAQKGLALPQASNACDVCPPGRSRRSDLRTTAHTVVTATKNSSFIAPCAHEPHTSKARTTRLTTCAGSTSGTRGPNEITVYFGAASAYTMSLGFVTPAARSASVYIHYTRT